MPKPVSFRAQIGKRRGRASTLEDKLKVRQAFVETGRHLLATEDPARLSLRRIAEEAGYSPGTIYQYFQDHQALLLAIRESDMNEAIDHFEAFAARIADPVARVRRLFMFTVDYWLDHLEQFDALFGRSPHLPPLLTSEGQPYGQSPTVMRSLKVYYDAVEAMLASLTKRPLPARLAADTLLATTHGIVSFPRHTSTMKWSDTKKMARTAIDALVDSWLAQAR